MNCELRLDPDTEYALTWARYGQLVTENTRAMRVTVSGLREEDVTVDGEHGPCDVWVLHQVDVGHGQVVWLSDCACQLFRSKAPASSVIDQRASPRAQGLDIQLRIVGVQKMALVWKGAILEWLSSRFDQSSNFADLDV